MAEPTDRRSILVVSGLLITGAILVGSVFLGGQTSQILSTVGAALPNRPATGSSVDGQGDPAVGQDPAAGGGSGGGTDGGPLVADAGARIPTLLIVRTGEVRLEVPDLQAALRTADSAVLEAGGYVSGSTWSAQGSDASAKVTYRIPSVRWDPTLDALRRLAARVDVETIKTDEVTGQVIDLKARIANLRSTEAALQAIMVKAARISDVLDVQKQLTSTRGEIEQLAAEQGQLENQASFGNLLVTFHLPVVPEPRATPLPVKGWEPGADVAKASAKLVTIVQAGTTAGIWLAIVGLPLLVAGSILAFAAWQLYRFGRWIVRRREATVEGSA
ncbi:MAG: DUF4349 domain-containing protein [Candidatus Limnocylindrales bacterium]